MQSKWISGTFSLFLHTLFATVLLSSSSLDAISAPTAKRKMRHFLCNSFLFTRLSRIVLARGLPFSDLLLFILPSLLLLTPHAQHRPPLDPRHACFFSSFDFCFGLTAFTNFFRILVRAARLKTESAFGSSNFTDVSWVDNRTHGSQQSFDVSV